MSRLMDATRTRWPIIDWKDLLDLEKEGNSEEEEVIQNGCDPELKDNKLPLKIGLSDKTKLNKSGCNVMKILKDNDVNSQKRRTCSKKRVSFQENSPSIEFHGKCHFACGTYFKDWISGTHRLSGSRISIKVIGKNQGMKEVGNKDHESDAVKKKTIKNNSNGDNQDSRGWKRVMNERKIWQSLSHLSHVVPLISFINYSANCYFITPSIHNHVSLDAIMFDHKPLPIKASMIISGQLASVIDKIHSFGIILRNLSSASILIDDIGFLRLINFRDAKQINSSKHVIYDNADDDYKSPEMLKCKSYTDATDWWAFGIILLQLLSGSTPLAIYKEKTSISSEMDSLDVLLRATDLVPEMIAKVPECAQNLLQSLLQTNPRKRLGFDPSDFILIQKDEFYNGLSWKKLGSR